MNKEHDDYDSVKSPSNDPTTVKRSKRSTVRLALRAERGKLKELEKGMSEGRDLSDDINSCKGEIELLFKELQAIEEGGHTTFLEAKQLIAPKKNISAKKEYLRDQIERVNSEIAELQVKLNSPHIDSADKKQTVRLISKKEHSMTELKDELQALKNFNHTRFVNARDDAKRNNELYAKIEKIESELYEISHKLILAAEDKNMEKVDALNIRALDLKKEKIKLLTPQETKSPDIENSTG
jgi:chromosome segregation ATPase